ncbi:MAG: cytidylate kinase family protein [Clostridiales bacterium]|nr:cytidylate kinase family protein [Clostridiales bacterium]
MSEAEAHRLSEKTDKYPAAYYRYQTKGQDWRNPINYDLTLNSARIGCDCCVDLLEYYVKKKFSLE